MRNPGVKKQSLALRRGAIYFFTMLLSTWAAAQTNELSGLFSVRTFGAVGDGRTDDTAAFERAIKAAAEVGGVVKVAPVKPGGGYVLTHTVAIPPGVSLIGAPSGMPFFLWEGVPRAKQRGAVILARPREEDYRGDKKRPLFELGGGNTIRGVYILYDEQPWPSDAELEKPDTPYHYDSFKAFRDRFVKEHARPYGPTFYSSHAASVTIEDVSCHGYWDFCLFKLAGKVFIERVYLYGYKRAFAIQEAPDVVRIRGIHLVPNASAAISWRHAKLQAAICWQEDNIAFDFGAVDGYSVSDVAVFLAHTGFRLGADKDYPFVNTVTGQRFAPKWGRAPWGSMENIKLDNVCIGFDCVNGTILPNQLHNVMVHVSLPTSEKVEAADGPVARQAAFVIEPSFAGATVQVCNLSLSSFAPGRVLYGAQMVHQANGRAFLANCPGFEEKVDYADRRRAYVDITSLVVSNIPLDYLFTETKDNRARIRAAGFVHNGVRRPDVIFGEQ